MPELQHGKLWPIQVSAITNLEKSLTNNRPRSLIQMTMGSGKTFTSISFVYRLIKFAGARRVLFLVDRNNLGEQTENEFQLFTSPYNNLKFTEEYGVQRLTGNTISSSAKVVITTIQRLYAMLHDKVDFDPALEEESAWENAWPQPDLEEVSRLSPSGKSGGTPPLQSPLVKEALPVVYNPNIPIETFDFIVIDECHRSIYNQWRQVLDYFDAFLIGLTATPTKQTIGFFNGNLVEEYGHEAAVADNVNVGFDVYTILTKITVQGAQLEKEPEFFVPHRDRCSKATIHKELDETVTYAPGELDRDVVAEDQIRLIIKTFNDRLFTDNIFPGRTEVPKTLIFAKTDLNADDIVKIVREEFGRSNEFCQKITSKSQVSGKALAAGSSAHPYRRLAPCRSHNPRIAGTVSRVATADVKPLECLIFMWNIKSWSYFEQMKGRVIDANSLKSFTPDAACKTRFVIVDAVGLCKQDKNQSKPLDRQPTVGVSGKALAAGSLRWGYRRLAPCRSHVVPPDLASTLGAKISRLAGSRSDAWHADIEKQTSGQPVSQLISTLFDSVDADKNRELAASKFSVTPDAVTGTQLDEIEALRVREALPPFHNPQLREILLRSAHQVINKLTRDQRLTSSFDPEAKQRAETLVTSFRRRNVSGMALAAGEDNKDEIEAISILYSRPHSAGLRYGQVKELARRLSIKPFPDASASLIDESQPQTLLRLWQAFGTVAPDKVDTGSGTHCKPCFAQTPKRFKYVERKQRMTRRVPYLPMIHPTTFSRSGVRFNDGGDRKGSLQRRPSECRRTWPISFSS